MGVVAHADAARASWAGARHHLLTGAAGCIIIICMWSRARDRKGTRKLWKAALVLQLGAWPADATLARRGALSDLEAR